MLANNTKLAYKVDTAQDYTELKDLKEIPDLGGDPEMVENSRINAKYKQYEIGVGDAGDLVYLFAFDNSTTDSDYRKLSALADTEDVVQFEQTYPDGTTATFSGQISLKIISAGGLNTVVDFEMTVALQSDIVIGNPA